MTWLVSAAVVACSVAAGWVLRCWCDWRAAAKAADKLSDEFRTDIHWGL